MAIERRSSTTFSIDGDDILRVTPDGQIVWCDSDCFEDGDPVGMPDYVEELSKVLFEAAREARVLREKKS